MQTELTYSGGTALEQRPEDDVSGLVRLAIEQKVPVDILERLVALQERVTERNARGAFFEALASFQDMAPEIRKTKKAEIASRSGASYSYSYAPLEEITRAIRPALKANGLSYSWDVQEGEKSLIVICVLRHIDGHHERASFPVPIDTSARMSDAQKNGAALTYGRRQSLIAVLGLTTADEDKDGAGKDLSAEPITEREAADLQALIDEVKADKNKFLAWVGAPSLAAIPRRRLRGAMRELESRR